MNNPYRFALEMFDGRGAPLCQEPVTVDLQPAEEWTRFMAIRTGALPAVNPEAKAYLYPIWHSERGRPYTNGFRVRLEMDHRKEVESTFTALYFGELAQEASSRLVKRSLLQPGETFRYIVAAYPQEERKEQTPPRFRAEEISPALPLREGILATHLEAAEPRGEIQQDDIPVFMPRSVLEETAVLARAAGAVETGGILVGHLHRDAEAGEVFAVITAQIPAIRAQGERASLKFTPETWTHLQGILALRDRGEMMLGWHHSHPQCRDCPAESRRRCSLSNGFFSTNDRSLHRAVFSGAYGLALVVNVIGDGEPTHSMFGWRHGLLQPRGFHLVDRAP